MRRHAPPMLAVLLVALLAPVGRALPITLDPPHDGEYVRDLAGLLTPGDRARVNAVGAALLRNARTPILVVTIESMARHGGAGLRIETFSTILFDQWGVGHARDDDGEPWNTGILLLVSKGDRKARIELGAGWRREYDRRAERIMEGEIVPRFRSGNFSAGIRAGVEALDRMARDATPAMRAENRAAAGAVPAAPSRSPQREPVRLEDMPVERPLPTPGAPRPSAPVPPPPVLDPADVPVEPPPRQPASPTPPRRTRDDHLVYPSRGSSGASFMCALVPLIFFVVVVLIVISAIRRGLRGIGYLTGHHSASGLGMLMGALNASQRYRSGYGRQHWGSSSPPPPANFGAFPPARPSSGGFFSSSSGSSRRSGSSFGSGGGSSSRSSSSSSSRGGGSSGGGGATGSW